MRTVRARPPYFIISNTRAAGPRGWSLRNTIQYYLALPYPALPCPALPGGRGTARRGTAWRGAARHGTASHGAGWHGAGRHGTAKHGTAWHGMAWHGTARHGTVLHRHLRYAPHGIVTDDMLWLRVGQSWHSRRRRACAREGAIKRAVCSAARTCAFRREFCDLGQRLRRARGAQTKRKRGRPA